MHFLYPIGLLALAGLIVPFMIHLWNVKQGKTVKIGSIALLGESSRASAKSVKINDWLLLLLRCLLLALLVLFIAKPYFKKIAMAENRTGWVLLDRATFKQVFDSNKKTIDSLLRKGYEIHDFNVGFKTLTLKDTADDQTKPAINLSYTALLHSANQFIPASAGVYLFANRRLTHFGDELPMLNYKLNWIPLNQTDTLSSWITGYAGKKYEAKSNPSNTTYQDLNSGDEAPINIAVHQAPGTADGKYLIAALKAIGSFTNRKIMINSRDSKADIGFWLSGDAVTANFKSSITTNGILFQYESGKVVAEPSFINLDGRHIKLSKRIASTNNTKKIWTDGFGNAILTKEKADALHIFHFYSRFNPAWNELVWDGLFVKALMPMVISTENTAAFGFENNPADQRRLSARQNMVFHPSETESTMKNARNVPLQPLFWAAAILIFVTERILSFRKKTR
ncbi:BatA domain-containing protein [Pedobacter sp. KLB.chiD]|uniref:BatA domain-containing protein n=1 Tax=Pedobacter sp. KLB.chiD TaxID=3387402 RepID=UPI00399BCC80